MERRIGILTGGGDAPGQNVCLKSLVYRAIEHGFQVVGIRKGWEGLIRFNPDNPMTHAENTMTLTRVRTRDIDRLPGAFLHSSRVNPAALPVAAVPAFLRPGGATTGALDTTAHIQTAIDKLGLEGLVVLGDRGALSYAAHLSAQGVPVIGVPKSVHNDVNGTDYTLGFSTALGSGVRFINEIRAMAASREEIAIVEILGRATGLTTLLISLLAGVDRALIPEVAFDPETLARLLLEDKRDNPTNYAILALSEVTRVDSAKASAYLPELSRLANSRTLAEAIAVGEQERIREQILADIAAPHDLSFRIAGSGAVVTEILENLTGQRILFQPLSYLIRTGEPDGQDLLGAMNFAALATRLVVKGAWGRLVTYRQRENYTDLPLAIVSQQVGNINVADFYDAATLSPKPGLIWAAGA